MLEVLEIDMCIHVCMFIYIYIKYIVYVSSLSRVYTYTYTHIHIRIYINLCVLETNVINLCVKVSFFFSQVQKHLHGL